MMNRIQQFIFIIWTTFSFSQTAPEIPLKVNSTSDGYFGPSKVIVKLDPFSRIQTSDIPQDRNFYIRVYFNKDDTYLPAYIKLMDLKAGKTIGDELPIFKWTADINSKEEDSFLKLYNAFDILMPPLEPNREYSLYFVYPNSLEVTKAYAGVLYERYKNTEESAKKLYDKSGFKQPDSSYTPFDILMIFYQQYQIGAIFKNAKSALGGNPSDIQIIDKALPEIFAKAKKPDNYVTIGNIRQTVFLEGALVAPGISTQPNKIESSAPLRLIGDMGVVYVGFQKGFSEVTPYVGVCISLRPYDPDVQFQRIKNRLNAWDRLGLHLGLTLNSIAKASYRGDIFGSNNLMTGVSYRFSNVICLTGGTLFYNNIDPNPLLDRKTLAVAPYFGISINLRIRSAFGELSKVFAK
jgi:hypothetical protein